MASSSLRMEIDRELFDTLATKAYVSAKISSAIAPLATKAELAAAIAPLATREELQAGMAAIRAEIKEEGERTRHYFDVVAERLESSIRIIAEGHTALDRKADAVHAELKEADAALDRRVTRLESRFRRR
jgi:hypothetical protein